MVVCRIRENNKNKLRWKFKKVLLMIFLFSDIQYEEMKAKLVMCIQEAPSPESVEPDHLTRYFAKFDEAFFTFCEKGESYVIRSQFFFRNLKS